LRGDKSSVGLAEECHKLTSRARHVVRWRAVIYAAPARQPWRRCAMRARWPGTRLANHHRGGRRSPRGRCIASCAGRGFQRLHGRPTRCPWGRSRG